MRESQRIVLGRALCAVATIGSASLLLVGCATAISGTPTRAVAGFPSSSAASISASPLPTDEPDPTPAASTDSSSSSGDGNSPEVVPLLLTVADLPAGWKIDDSGDDDPDSDADAPDCLQNADVGSDLDVSGEADFERDGSGLGFLTESIGIDPDPSDATSKFTQTTAGLAACKTFSYVDSGDTVHGTVAPLTLTAHGDQFAAFRVVLSGSGFIIYFDLQLIRKGNQLVALLLGDTKAPSATTAEQISAKAYAKLS